MGTVTALIIAFLMIVANAFYVLAEFSIVKVRKSRIQELVNTGNPLAPLVSQRILPSLDAYLSVCQIGITVSSLALGWIGEPAAGAALEWCVELIAGEEVEVPHALSFGVAFFLVTATHVVFGELVPKSLALQKADTMALWCARPLQASYILFYPILAMFNMVANVFIRLIGLEPGGGSEVKHSPQELRIILTSSRDKGIIDPQVFAIIDNAFRFRARTVRDVMVPRDKVAILSLGKSWEENRETIRRHRHTRYPLVQTDIDSPTGFIHLKDMMLRFAPIDEKDVDLEKFRRDLVEIEPDLSLNRALTELRSQGAHMAVVRGSVGAVEGIVCLEDIVELIVGTLEDEFDREEKVSVLDLLEPELVDARFEANDKNQVLQNGLELLRSAKPELNVEEALEQLIKRESLFSTGIGGGVAIPHAILEDLDKPLFAVLNLRKGVRFGAIDLMPVRLVFLFLLPATNPGLRIRFFSEIARLLQAPKAYYRLTSAPSPEKMIEIIKELLEQEPKP